MLVCTSTSTQYAVPAYTFTKRSLLAFLKVMDGMLRLLFVFLSGTSGEMTPGEATVGVAPGAAKSPQPLQAATKRLRERVWLSHSCRSMSSVACSLFLSWSHMEYSDMLYLQHQQQQTATPQADARKKEPRRRRRRQEARKPPAFREAHQGTRAPGLGPLLKFLGASETLPGLCPKPSTLDNTQTSRCGA